MKPNVRILSLVAFMVSLVTSCVNEGLQEPQDASALKMIPSLEEQTVAVEASMEELHELQAALESNDVKLEGMAAAEQQAAVISKGGASLEEGTLAAFELQKQIARILGPAVASLDSEIYESEFKERFDALELGISKWVGKDFASLYPAALAEAVTKAAVADLDGQLSRQKLYVDALASDVEAGLRNDEKPGELISLAASVQEAAANSEKLASELTALASEVEEEYEAAVKSIISDPSGFDGAALKQFNSNVGVELASADNTLESLSARVAACEVQLSAILERLGSLETEIEDLEGLLEMVQSVTFMSKYSEDKAVAYYTMNVSGASDAQGRKPRTPDGTIELQYVVRPASAAAALTSSSMWNDGLKIFGYYAESITKAAGDFFDFTITNVTADQTTGVATITVNNALSSSFFFKEIGAKVALSLATGETDLTSKFVEIVPKDKSDNVYVESLTLSDATLEIDNGETAVIKATVSPSDVTTGGVTWASNNTDVLTVAADGTITTKAVGTAVVTATTKGVDEWGNALTATCTVKVNPAVKLVGPTYVEEGETIEITVESPDYINPSSISWELTDITNPSYYAIVTSENGVGKITGVKNTFDTSSKTYKVMKVKCTIAGAMPLELTQELRVVAVQPKGVEVEGLDFSVNTLTLKKGQGYTFKSSIQPADKINMSYFRILYQTNNPGVVRVPDINSGYIVANDLGSSTIDIKVTDQGQYNYFYPAREDYRRSIIVNVEPYYVTGMSFTESGNAIGADGIELAANSSTQVSIAFTSDGGEGVLPTYTDVSWTSSDESVIVVDQSGNITAKDVDGKEATITVTTANPNAVSGNSPISASFKVSVTKPWHSFEVGDYVLRESDGSIAFASSYSSDIRSKIVGVVIAKLNPRSTDTALPADCIHGIAMGLTESSVVQWWNDYPTYGTNYIQSVDKYATQNAYESMLGANYNYYNNPQSYVSNNGDKAYGYNNTLAFKAYLNAAVANEWKVAVFNTETYANEPGDVVASQLMTALNNISSSKPNNTSDWYLPSVYEMNMISSFVMNDDGNTKLTNAGGITLSNDSYWTISESAYSTASNAVLVNPTTGALKANESKKNSHKTRFIFAF